jgi:glutathionylspermidine synthase
VTTILEATMTPRREVAEVWPRLPAEVRDRMLAYGHKSWHAVYEGVRLANQDWIPLRPPVLTHAGYAELSRVTEQMSRMVLAACRRRARTAGQLREALGVPPGELDLLDESEPLTGRLMSAVRSDVLLERGVPRFVEFNVGSALGGVRDSEGTVARWLQAYAEDPVLRAAGVAGPPSATDARFDALRAFVGPRARVAMLFNVGGGSPLSDRPHDMMRLLQSFVERGNELGVDICVYPLQWVERDAEGRLRAGDRTIDAVLRMYAARSEADDPGRAAVRAAVDDGSVLMYLPTATSLLGNKTIFSWLWEDLAEMTAEDAELVRQSVPRTERLCPDLVERAVRDQQRLVLKPTDEFGGRGVVLGPEVTPQEWRAALTHALGAGPHLLQELVAAEPLTMQFVRPVTGETVEAKVPYCVASYVFDGIPAGGFSRFLPPGAGGVVNLTQGALTGGLLLVDEMRN